MKSILSNAASVALGLLVGSFLIQLGSIALQYALYYVLG